MNCEMAEENLSAYLDDMLDPPDRATIQSHLDGCVRCREILDDYRRYDTLLVHLPRVAPPAELRASIFESPQYLALVRDLERKQQQAGARAGANGSGRHRTTAPPAWRGIGLQAAAAAAVVLVIGAALLVKQGLFTSSSHTGSTSTSTIGKPGQTGVPLAAGNRLIFLHANALWSAPEVGPAQAQQLTPRGTFVAGFAVSPNGHSVAYVDSIHGALHVIRSDGQSDTTIVAGHGLQMLGAPVWSPDGQQIAYAVNSTSGPVLHLINSSGTNDRVISAVGSGTVSSFEQVIWSGDALRVAWVQTANGAQSLWMYDLVSHKTQQLAAQADPANAGTRFRELVWLPDTLHPALSWAAGETVAPGAAPTGTSLTGASGVFTLALSSGSVQRLTPAGATYVQAQFTAARGDGAWVLVTDGSSATLQAIAADSGATITTTSVPASVTIGLWSPDGSSVAYVTASGDLALWAPGNAPVVVLHGATGFPAWSPDGAHLAVPTSGGVVSVAISSGSSSGSPTHLSGSSAQAPVAAFWAPDGHAVVIVSPSSLVIVASDGTQSRSVEQGSVTGTMAWSVAG
ncbi:MAG TPA: zf-HC2 domain-containing protein [Ktedonobacterales bacterium]